MRTDYDVTTSFERIHNLRRALERIDSTESSAQYAEIVADLCRAVFVGSGRVEDLRAILHHLIDEESRTSLLQARTLWLRGMILSRFGGVRHAVRLLERAERVFRSQHQTVPSVQVALDLSIFYGDLDRWTDMRRKATDAVFLFRANLPLEALAALLLWRDAVLHGDACDEVVVKARAALAGVPAGDVGIPPSLPPDENDEDSPRGSYWPRSHPGGNPCHPVSLNRQKYPSRDPW